MDTQLQEFVSFLNKKAIEYRKKIPDPHEEHRREIINLIRERASKDYNDGRFSVNLTEYMTGFCTKMTVPE